MALLAMVYCGMFVMLAVATATDLYKRRIPNICTFGIMALALLGHGLEAGLPGLLFSLKGLGFGFFLLVLPYLLGGLGAGDVKLMAAVGAVLGVEHTFVAFLCIAMLGGLVTVAMMSVQGVLWPTLRNIGVMVYGLLSGAGLKAFQVDRSSLGRGGVPYGAVIAGGVGLYFAWFWFSGQGVPLPLS